MSVYERPLYVRSIDVGIERRMRPSVLFSLVQESAIAHTEELGMGREKTLDKGLLWIVTMQNAQIERMPEYDEHLILRTWPGKTMHLIFPRYFGLYTADGQPLVRVSSMWSLIDSRTRSIVFPEKHGISIEGETTGDEIPLPSSIRKADLKPCRQFTVPYSFVDLNGHMNNTRYLDLAEDCIYEELQRSGQDDAGTTGQNAPGRILRSVRTEYIREVRLGDTISLSCCREDSRWLVTGSKEKPCFRISLEYNI